MDTLLALMLDPDPIVDRGVRRALRDRLKLTQTEVDRFLRLVRGVAPRRTNGRLAREG